ncbi:MAG: GNAT family N-acetyltransferase [Segniliparus sp.]|uniref:GNAT family N-acetyltransferase n=1 Tax=Segniliparus sp. TaxID=2804064 RepID=UPI003F40C5C4
MAKPPALGPVRTSGGEVRLRPVRLTDAHLWSQTRIADQAHLEPWEPGLGQGWESRHQAQNWLPLWRQLRAQTKKGFVYPMVIEADRAYAGQLTIGGVQRGALQSAWLGYWVASRACGGGVATAATALAVDWCFSSLRLHRIEATVRAENHASRAVLRKLGFREEGLIRDYLRVQGEWRDHLLYGLTAPEAGGGIVARLAGEGKILDAPPRR